MRSRLARNIAQAISDSRLPVAEIARRMPGTINEKTIRRWRTGESRPNEENLAALAGCVGLSDLTWFYLPHDDELAAP